MPRSMARLSRCAAVGGVAEAGGGGGALDCPVNAGGRDRAAAVGEQQVEAPLEPWRDPL